MFRTQVTLGLAVLIMGWCGACLAQSSYSPVSVLGFGTIYASVFSPDGKILAVGTGKAHAIHLIDTQTWGVMRTLDGHSEAVRALTFSPQGDLLVSGSNDRTVKVWSVRTGVLLREYTATSVILSVAFSPDAEHIAFSTGDGIWLWRWKARERAIHLQSCGWGSLSVAFSCDGRFLAAGCLKGHVIVWEISELREVFRYNHPDLVLSVAFSPTDALLAVGSEKDIWLWDVSAKEKIGILVGQSPVYSLDFSPDGHLLASSHNREIRLWDLGSASTLAVMPSDTYVYTVSFSPDGKILVSGDEYGALNLWTVPGGKHLHTIPGHTWTVVSVAFAPDGSLLASGSLDGTITVWNVNTGQHVYTLRGHEGPVRSVAFSPTGKILASCSHDGTAKLWDVATGQELSTSVRRTNFLNAVAFSSGGDLLAIASSTWPAKEWRGLVELLDPYTGEIVGNLTGHEGWIFTIAFSPDGRLLASGGYDGMIRLWEISTGRELLAISGHTGAVRTVAFSPDGKLLASGSDDETVAVWNVTTGSEVLRLVDFRGKVTSVTFSPDGLILAATDGWSIKLWDGIAWREIAVIPEFGAYSLSFSPDGRIFAAGCWGYVRLWDVLSLISEGNDSGP